MTDTPEDRSAPADDVETFAGLGLDERLVLGLEKLGFRQPTPVQRLVIPEVLGGHDLLASAETGTGKTAAFLLPILNRFHQLPRPDSNTRCLVVLPTKELAAQIHQHCNRLAAFTGVTAALVTGGAGLREQQALLRKNPEVVIGTPGRLLELLQRGALLLDELEVLVLDEADRMLDMGFREDVLTLAEACHPERQTLLLSATLEHAGIGAMAKRLLREPSRVSLAGREARQAHIRQTRILADDNGHKRQLMAWLLANETFDKALVFTNTRDMAEELARFLSQHQAGVACLHGELPHEARRTVMQGFRERRHRILVATDLAARGLDVEGIDLVINFSMARSGDEHLHRCGRTGRAGRSGRAISLVSARDWNLSESVARYLGITWEPRSIKGLEARFQGEVKKRKKPSDERDRKGVRRKPANKAKERHRNRKNVGKRRSSGKAGTPPAVDEQGLKPLTRSKGGAARSGGKAGRPAGGRKP